MSCAVIIAAAVIDAGFLAWVAYMAVTQPPHHGDG